MKPRLELFIFIDALGWDIVKQHHFCEELLTERQKVETQFGYSAGAVPTILSGKTPEEHGHFSFFYFDPVDSPFKWMRLLSSRLLPQSLLARHRVRHHLSKWIAKRSGYTGYFQLYSVPFDRLAMLNYSEKNDLFLPGGLAPVKNLADLWQGKPHHISNWRNSSDYNFAEMERKVAEGEIEYGFLYSASFDGFLHRHVGEPAAIQMALQQLEDKIIRIAQTAAKSYREVRIAVLSDHGMTPFKGAVKLPEKLAKFHWGSDYAIVTDSTMARLWYLKKELKNEIANAMTESLPGHFLSETELKEYGIDFPGKKYGEDFFLLDPGFQFVPSDMGKKPLNGMHGYAPDAPGSAACILANFKPEIPLRKIGDFFQLMTQPTQGK